MAAIQISNIQKSYQSWFDIANKKPDYRDAFLILASLSYERAELTQAHAYAEQAFILDPNSKLASKLLVLTEKKK